MTDDERVRLATRDGRSMIGPKERERCQRHPKRWRTFVWIWRVGEDISSATPEIVRSCEDCLEEERWSE